MLPLTEAWGLALRKFQIPWAFWSAEFTSLCWRHGGGMEKNLESSAVLVLWFCPASRVMLWWLPCNALEEQGARKPGLAPGEHPIPGTAHDSRGRFHKQSWAPRICFFLCFLQVFKNGLCQQTVREEWEQLQGVVWEAACTTMSCPFGRSALPTSKSQVSAGLPPCLWRTLGSWQLSWLPQFPWSASKPQSFRFPCASCMS